MYIASFAIEYHMEEKNYMLISSSTTIGKSTHDWPKVLAGSGVEEEQTWGGIGRRHRGWMVTSKAALTET
jgi:hypothetical protein